jgi:hypothetical protein
MYQICLLTNKHDRPIYGKPMFAPFSFAPTNEQGVLFVFGGVAHELGLTVTRVQMQFPDIEAMREVGPNKCQRVHLEAEYESKNFLLHIASAGWLQWDCVLDT